MARYGYRYFWGIGVARRGLAKHRWNNRTLLSEQSGGQSGGNPRAIGLIREATGGPIQDAVDGRDRLAKGVMTRRWMMATVNSTMALA